MRFGPYLHPMSCFKSWLLESTLELGRPNEVGDRDGAPEPYFARFKFWFNTDRLCGLVCVASLPRPQNLHP